MIPLATMILLALACAEPDPAPLAPDMLLRAGKLDEALAAWEASGGRSVPAGHITAQALAVRAVSEPWITVALLVDLTEAAAILEAVPDTRTQSVDVSFERWATLAPCTANSLKVPWRVAVGRTTVEADADASEAGRPFENVPYGKGRIVGTAAALDTGRTKSGATALAGLFADLDDNPPSRRVTVVLTDPSGPLALNLSRRDGAWWTVSATNADAAAAWVVHCGRTP